LAKCHYFPDGPTKVTALCDAGEPVKFKNDIEINEIPHSSVMYSADQDLKS